MEVYFELNDHEKELTRWLAQRRCEEIKRANFGLITNESKYLDDIGAEVSAASRFNVFPNLNHFRFDYDIVINQMKFNIKRCDPVYENMTSDKFLSDINYLLMVGVFPSYKFGGWVKGKIAVENGKWVKNGAFLLLTKNYLNPIETLIGGMDDEEQKRSE